MIAAGMHRGCSHHYLLRYPRLSQVFGHSLDEIAPTDVLTPKDQDSQPDLNLFRSLSIGAIDRLIEPTTEKC